MPPSSPHYAPSSQPSSIGASVVLLRGGVRRVLIVDDDPLVRDVALEQLADPGRRMTAVDSIEGAGRAAPLHKPDLVIVGAVDETGGDLSSRMRRTFQAPVVPLFRPALYTRPRQGLVELSAPLLSALADCRIRVGQHLKARTPPSEVVMHWGEFTIKLEAGAFAFRDQDLGMTRVESTILSLLMRHAGELIAAALIEQAIFSAKPKSQSNFIPVHISRIRSKLRASRSEIFIENVRGGGYILFWSRPFASSEIPWLEKMDAERRL